MLVQLLLQAEIQPTRKGVVERSCGHAIIMRVLSPRDQCRDRADEVSKVLVGLAIDMKMNMTLLEDEAIFSVRMLVQRLRPLARSSSGRLCPRLFRR